LEFAALLLGAIGAIGLLIYQTTFPVRRRAKTTVDAEKTAAEIGCLQHDIVRVDAPLETVKGRDAHIFQYLMVTWYDFLAVEYRVKTDLSRSLNNEMLFYIEMLRKKHLFLFLNAKGRDVNIGSESVAACTHECEAIESSFAARIGTKAIEALNSIHQTDESKFSRTGLKAPQGYQYGEDDKLKPLADFPFNVDDTSKEGTKK
jgi:hypothetical protein